MGRLYDHAADLVRRVYDARIHAPAVLDCAALFPQGLQIARSWPQIRGEAEALAGELAGVPRFHEIMREQAPISANDGRDWRLFILKAYGIEFPRNIARCPLLYSLLRGIPDVLSASVSFLAPGKHIPAHRGPFRGVLRFYLMLSTPAFAGGGSAALLRIAGRDYWLEDGEFLLWDDTFVHEVRNQGDTVRAALLLDVWRRNMPWDMRAFSHLLLAVVRAGIRLRGPAA
ncbi:MAG: aspartyl/asparaginyl beta-hydroxylase domain-containing protein [Nevskia sp.]|nr:aspartyl/asparaginyl beta-hydroxylase domain-containing protein [Nevskia sp.]